MRHQGFKVFTSRIAVDARPRPPMKVVLEIASVAEEVTVGKGGLSTASRENRDAVTVDQKLLQGLPVFDQDYIATLATFLDPGALGSEGVSLVVDGAEANRVLVSPSAIQEVKINQNPYSAEYFRPGRGRIEVVTKQLSKPASRRASPGNGRSVVLRAGIGVFNDRFPPFAAADLIRYDGRHLSSFLLLDPTYPDPTVGAGLSNQPPNLAQFDPTVHTPYMIQYSVGAEWQIAKDTTVAATYRGSRGVSLLRSRDINAPQAPDYDGRPDPAVGRVRQLESAGRQVSDAIELSFRGKVGKAFTGLAQYTLSRTDVQLSARFGF